MFIDRRILFDKGIRSRHIGFGLVIIVVGDEILHRIMRKVFLHLPVKLCRECFIVRHDDRGAFELLNHVGDGKGFTGTGYTQQGLVHQAIIDALYQFFDRFRLISGGLIISLKFKFLAHSDSKIQ